MDRNVAVVVVVDQIKDCYCSSKSYELLRFLEILGRGGLKTKFWDPLLKEKMKSKPINFGNTRSEQGSFHDPTQVNIKTKGNLKNDSNNIVLRNIHLQNKCHEDD